MKHKLATIATTVALTAGAVAPATASPSFINDYFPQPPAVSAACEAKQQPILSGKDDSEWAKEVRDRATELLLLHESIDFDYGDPKVVYFQLIELLDKAIEVGQLWKRIPECRADMEVGIEVFEGNRVKLERNKTAFGVLDNTNTTQKQKQQTTNNSGSSSSPMMVIIPIVVVIAAVFAAITANPALLAGFPRP